MRRIRSARRQTLNSQSGSDLGGELSTVETHYSTSCAHSHELRRHQWEVCIKVSWTAFARAWYLVVSFDWMWYLRVAVIHHFDFLTQWEKMPPDAVEVSKHLNLHPITDDISFVHLTFLTITILLLG